MINKIQRSIDLALAGKLALERVPDYCLRAARQLVEDANDWDGGVFFDKITFWPYRTAENLRIAPTIPWARSVENAFIQQGMTVPGPVGQVLASESDILLFLLAEASGLEDRAHGLVLSLDGRTGEALQTLFQGYASGPLCHSTRQLSAALEGNRADGAFRLGLELHGLPPDRSQSRGETCSEESKLTGKEGLESRIQDPDRIKITGTVDGPLSLAKAAGNASAGLAP